MLEFQITARSALDLRRGTTTYDAVLHGRGAARRALVELAGPGPFAYPPGAELPGLADLALASERYPEIRVAPVA